VNWKSLLEQKVCYSFFLLINRNTLCLGVDEFLRSFEQSVAKLCSYVESLQPDVRQLNASLKLVAGLAENISSRVASLDQAKGRVVECLQLVNDLLDLRTCAEGVQSAMRSSNYDEAAQHIHRFLTLDSAVFKVGDQVGLKGNYHNNLL
jgi:exonuclease VII small subunit